MGENINENGDGSMLHQSYKSILAVEYVVGSVEAARVMQSRSKCRTCYGGVYAMLAMVRMRQCLKTNLGVIK